MARRTPIRFASASLGFIQSTPSSSTADLTSFAQQAAQRLRSQRSTKTKIERDVTVPRESIRSLGEADLATDLTMARSLEAYRRRSVAPMIPISSAVKENLPSFRRQRPRRIRGEPVDKRIKDSEESGERAATTDNTTATTTTTTTTSPTGHISARNVQLTGE
ncbi:hypothetical protein CI109_102203 [Kwoniella shandongensis]|uniref:Uncharacterized protein n=1 Tax=Kwoniella shandongensis TaxID=1734106 RepID=A0AAJ8LH51_9TREE